MKRVHLKLTALIIGVSALTVLSSCETSARYIGSNTWEGEVKEVYHDTSEWYALSQNDISTNENGTLWSVINQSSYTKFYLSEDITLSSADCAIWVESSITLCLNGHNINAYSEAGTKETEGIISIKSGASLTLEDCAATEHTGGKITGGKDVYNSEWVSGGSGGGISISEGTLIMNGGIIEGNSADYLGGGIYNYKGYVEINGGSIKNNTAGQEGGGIYNDNGTLVINGGEISGNSAVDGGGIYSNCDSTNDDQGLYIKGGTITGNSAETDAGGVKFEHYVES
ncbi:MAG: hypothetical protein LUD22_01305, partial [Coprobacillus sp.]|nr:hypothetical protein [Coprobacillus sp.]